MAFKYVNPGYGSLLDYQFPTTQINKIYNPINEVYFENTNRTPLLKFPENLKEIYFKFWVFTGASYRVYFNDTDYTKMVGVNLALTYLTVWNKNSSNDISVPNFRDKFTSFKLHIKTGVTDGIIEIYMNNNLVYSYEGNVVNGVDLENLTLQDSNSWGRISNMIISDSNIFDEEVIIVPMKTTYLDGFTPYDNTFKTTEENATISKMVDVEALKTKLEGNFKITSIGICATHAFAFDGTMNKIQSFLKNGDITNDGEIKEFQQQNSKLGVYTQPFNLNPFTGEAWKVDDLNNVEFGLKSKK